VFDHGWPSALPPALERDAMQIDGYLASSGVLFKWFRVSVGES
jgi:hypothetical protein